MRHIYIFNEASSNAAKFGVGTYVNNLLLALKGEELKITVCITIAENRDVYLEVKESVRYIYIPGPANLLADHRDYYFNVFFLLYPYIDQKERNLFHFNYLNCCLLAKQLKLHFSAHIVLSIHYRQLAIAENVKLEKEFVNQYCDKILVPATHSCLSLCKEYGVDPQKVVTLQHGISDQFKALDANDDLSIRKHFEILPQEKVILYVGRIDENKNVAVLINAFLKLTETTKNIRLVIAGSGAYDSAFNVIKQAWGKITFTGFLDKQELYKLYRITSVGVVPSLYEEFGYVALEMMMHKVPTIVADTSGLSELIEDGVSGVKIPLLSPDKGLAVDEAELSKQLTSLLAHPTYAQRLGENARKCFLEKYESSYFKENMLSFYQEIY